MRWVSISFFWLSLISSAAAQTTSPVIRVDVREVAVPVFVTDSKGHHVSGLKASDFEIKEDGVVQQVTAFSTDLGAAQALMPSSSEQPAAVTETPHSSPKPLLHTFVICVDTLHTAAGDSARVREALARLLAKEKAGAAQYSVVGVGRRLQVLETVTDDPVLAVSKIRGAAFQAGLGGGDAAALTSEIGDLKNSMFDFCRRCPACGSTNGNASCAPEIQSLKVRLDGEAERWSSLTKEMLAQLKAVVEELAKLPSARTLVFVSDGFSLQAARDFYSVAAAFLPAAPQFKTAGPIDLAPALEAVIKAAVAGNVRIDSVDSRGVFQSSLSAQGSMDASAPSDRSAPSVIRHVPPANRGGGLLSDMDRQASSLSFQNSAGMEQLAQTTGGLYLHNNNDLLKHFQTVLADGREYYLLSYVPSNTAQTGAFRTISVDVKRGKELRVRAKAGYWEQEKN